MTKEEKQLEKEKFYQRLIPRFQRKGREHGYNLVVHGSVKRDLDMVAIPWEEEASDRDVLVEAIRGMCHGHISIDSPTYKPHGRVSYAIHLHHRDAYLDLSVVPKESEDESDVRDAIRWAGKMTEEHNKEIERILSQRQPLSKRVAHFIDRFLMIGSRDG